MLNYYEMYGKFYSHLTPDDLANEEWRYAVIDGETSDRFIVSSCGRFADLRPKKTRQDLGRWYEVPEFGKCQIINVSAETNQSKKNADDDYLCLRLGKKKLRAHVIVVCTFIGEIPKGWTVDHIVERNAYDNRVSNLQILSGRDNDLKGKIARARKSRIPVGVSWETQRSKWRVDAPKEKNGPRGYVGYFDRLRTAAEVAELMYTENRLCDSTYVREMLINHYKDLAPNLDDVEREFRAKLNPDQLEMVIDNN